MDNQWNEHFMGQMELSTENSSAESWSLSFQRSSLRGLTCVGGCLFCWRVLLADSELCCRHQLADVHLN